MTKYRILDGSFRDSDGSVKGAGDEIELGEDIAAAHAHRIEPVSESSEAPADLPAPQ